MELRKYIKSTIRQYLNENRGNTTIFNDVPEDIFNSMKSRRYSDDDNRETMGVFKGKDNKEYLIIKNINSDVFKVYNLMELENMYKNNEQFRPNHIAIAHFDVNHNKKSFSGYVSNESINVEPKYRRLGIATAITDFAENLYKMSYVPSEVLSSDMQNFVKNRFK